MSAKKRSQKSNRRAGGTHEVLPALASLTEMPEFTQLRADANQLSAYKQVVDDLVAKQEMSSAELDLGCVVRLDRGFPAVLCEDKVFRCEYATTLSKAKVSVCVGDWVCVRRPSTHDKGLIVSLLPRRNEVSRWRGGKRGEIQVLAANVDKVLVAQPLGSKTLSCERIVRSAVVAYDCGCSVTVVLTKADLCKTAAKLKDEIGLLQDILAGKIEIVVTAAKSSDQNLLDELKAACSEMGAGWGRQGVIDCVRPGQVGIVLGESGAGKSTLLNDLLGKAALETGSVRQKDGAGRHTTVARRMVKIPGGGVIVDEPGLRSLPVLGHERGLAQAFPDIAVHAPDCKFRDCTHTQEPGCAVIQAFEDGEFSKNRLDNYLFLANEMRSNSDSLDPDIII